MNDVLDGLNANAIAAVTSVAMKPFPGTGKDTRRPRGKGESR
jgi:hypothetical protein